MLNNNNFTIEQIGSIHIVIRSAAFKFRVKQYYLFLIYFAYIACNRSIDVYTRRSQLTLCATSKNEAIYKMIKLGLINRIEVNCYSFTPLACEVINYIDDQLANLESK